METNISCSEDSFDAIYKCSCLKMLCPKHYFSHQENFPDHIIDRIKMNVNNESRQILTNLVATWKKKLMNSSNARENEFFARNFENYQSGLASLNSLMHCLNLLLLFLAKTKYTFKKTFYTPFEYFLHQPTEKASKYASGFKFPEDFKNIFEFNYFKFEDKRYIFGFQYNQICDNLDVSTICKWVIGELFSCSEYEMGYEALQNYINIKEIIHSKDASFWLQFAKIVYDFIKKRKTIKLIKEWKKIDANLSKDYYISFYSLSKKLFEGLNESDLVFYILEKEEISMQDYEYKSSFLYKLGLSFFKNRNYKKAKKYFSKCIRQFRSSFDSRDFNYVIKSCSILVSVYFYHNKNPRKVKKIANIVNKIIESYGKLGHLDEALLYFHCVMHDWDNAHKMAWKLIKLYKKNQTNYLTSSKSEIYLYLAFIYRELGYDKQFLQALANAKSCCGILSMNDGWLCKIDEQFGFFYYKNKQYKEAAHYYEHIINNYQKNKIKLTLPKFYAGMARYCMKHYDKALQYFIEIEDDILAYPSMNNNWLFQIYSCMGESYNCTNNKERANYYFFKAYELLNQLEYRDGFDNFDLYWYFRNNCDYEKCKSILKIWWSWLEKSTDLGFKIMVFYEMYVLYKQQNKLEWANIIWEKAEKLLDIEKMSLMPKKQIYAMWDKLVYMTFIYIYDKKDFFKAEKILKICELALNSHIPSDAGKLKILYESILDIYNAQNRLVEISTYSQKFLNLLKLADQNEIWRENMEISKAEINEMIKKYQ